MVTNNLLWVLGHKIRLLDTDESYGMIEVTSPPDVPGPPPPHFHKSESEFFFIIQISEFRCKYHRPRRNLWPIRSFKMC